MPIKIIPRPYTCLIIPIVIAIASPRASAEDRPNREELLAAAQQQLIVDAAQPLTQILNDRATEKDRSALRKITTQAKSTLDAFHALKQSEGKDAKKFTARGHLLSALAGVFDAIGTLEPSDASKSRLTDAAIELELFVDDPNKDIAEAARLWQGLAYRLANKPERSLKILYPILQPGSRSPVDLYCRFERCRALSQAGQHVAAIALSIRTTRIARDWPGASGPAHQEPVLAAKQLVADLYRNWAKALTEQGETDRANDANQRAQKIQNEVTQGTFDDTFRLTHTVIGLEKE